MQHLNRLIIFVFIMIPANCLAAIHWNFSEQDIIHTKSALYFAERGSFDEALYHAKLGEDQTPSRLVLWMKYTAPSSGASFMEIADFVTKYPSWPNQNVLKQRAEEAMDSSVPHESILNWFNNHSPKTSNGYKIRAIVKAENPEHSSEAEIHRAIKEAWVKADFSKHEENDFLEKYGDILTIHEHIARIDELLWKRRIDSARRIMSLVDNDHQKLFRNRIRIIEGENNFQAIINDLPLELKNDYGILYEVALSYADQGNRNNLRKILCAVKSPKKFQEKWWTLKSKEIRELIQEENFKTAYIIAKYHNNKDKSDFADAEWLAGWIALRFLKDPQSGYSHFYHMYKSVKTPISLSRAAYWAGRASKGTKHAENAVNWYQIAARYPDTFYGQLSLVELQNPMMKVPPHPKPTVDEIKHFKSNTVAKAADLLAKCNRIQLTKEFVKSAVKAASTVAEVALITELGVENNNHHLAVEAAKQGSRDGHLIAKTSYPLLPKLKKLDVELSLALAVIRQESVFDHYAESYAGARGLMQLMPETAQKLSKELKIKFNQGNLKSNYLYNVRLGSYFLKKLIDNYDGSYILAIAAYNAGQKNVQKWVAKFGDPRDIKKIEDVVDWLELIPFYETRNYVQRVLENLQVYRLITVHQSLAMPLLLEKDLKR